MVKRAAPLAALWLGACASVPPHSAEPQPIGTAAVASARSLESAAGADWPAEGWWARYGDPQLDALIAEGLRNAPDVAAADARFRRAGALAQQVGAASQPRVDVTGQVQEQKQSLNLGYPPEFQSNLPRGWNDGGQVAAQAGFDLHLWGRNRAVLAAATSELQAARIDARQARLTLAVGIASAYFDLDRLGAERETRVRELASADSSRKLLAQRQANGLETRGSVATAAAQAATARGALNQIEELLILRRHQIAALIGAGPDRGLAVTRPMLSAMSARELPADVTTELVSRRPDVAAARARVDAASSRIKVARAEFYPAIRLSALLGFQSLGLETLFHGASSFGQVGPAFALPLFRGGELRGRYRGARADYDAAVASYDGAVLNAYRETADAVTAVTMTAQRLADARAAMVASQDAFAVASARYRGGLFSYLDVLQVEDRLLASQLAHAAAEAAVRNADLALVRALGGGFSSAAAANPKEAPYG
ncbi:MAG: efflux transporter outer membrane subunit [Pseudomonadota bacterium]